jgi:hypothetical protein
MNRTTTEAEKIYIRVRSFVISSSSQELSSLRRYITQPTVMDYLFKRIRKEIGCTAIENDELKVRYSFLYGEREFSELIRQIL